VVSVLNPCKRNIDTTTASGKLLLPIFGESGKREGGVLDSDLF